MALHIGEATSITFKTMPYIFLRLLVYSIFGICFSLYWIGVYFVGALVAPLHEYAQAGVWILALLFSFPIVKLVREYFLYVLKAGHVAVMAELVTKGSLPEGVSQLAWGKEKVQKTFKEVSVLFLVDRLVAGVISAINGIMSRMGGAFSSIPGLSSLVQFANLVLKFSLTYVDEAILARNFVTEKESVWESAKTGLVLYAQIWRQILGTAMILGFIAILLYIVLTAALLVPFLGLAHILNLPQANLAGIAGAVVFAAVLKFAIFDPWTLANMIVVYLKETQGKVPDASWESKLAAVSKKFRKIQEKAVS